MQLPSYPDDGRAADYARAALAGSMPEAEARKSLGWLLAMSQLPGYWATSYTPGGLAYLRDEVEDAIKDALLRKCCQSEGSGLDLQRIADGVKLSSWAFGLCMTGRFQATIMRSVRAARDRSGCAVTFSQLEKDDHDQNFHRAPEPAAPAASEVTDIRTRIGYEDVARYAITRAKSGARIHIGARHLAGMHGLAVPRRTFTAAQRQRVKAEVDRRRGAAATAAREALAGSEVCTYPTLTGVFSDSYTTAELGRLVQAPTEISYAIAMSVATPRPAVHRAVRGALTALARSRCDAPGWEPLAGRLVHAFLVALADLPPEDSNAFKCAQVRSAVAARRDEQAFLGVAADAAAFPGSPLGSIPAAVEAEVHSMLVQAETAVAGAAAVAETTALDPAS